MVERDAALVPTLAAIDRIVEAGAGVGMPAFVIEKARSIAEVATANLKRARAAGARFVAGSDAGTPFNRHEDFAHELDLMQRWLGMNPREVVAAATADAARLLDLDCGRLAPGAVADVVLLRAGVADGRLDFHDPLAVIKSGVVVRPTSPAD